MPVFQLDSGPWEIDLDGNLAGYFWVEDLGGNELDSYMVLEHGVSFPLPHTQAVRFTPMLLPEVQNSKEFYAWVMKAGNLGKGTTSWEIHESYSAWMP